MLDRPRGLAKEVMQGLGIVESNGFGDSRERLMFTLANHAQMQQFEGFKATHLWEESGKELAAVIDESDSGSSFTSNRHKDLTGLEICFHSNYSLLRVIKEG
jgi:hypothetical protein